MDEDLRVVPYKRAENVAKKLLHGLIFDMKEDGSGAVLRNCAINKILLDKINKLGFEVDKFAKPHNGGQAD